jgi:hypothetical protein
VAELVVQREVVGVVEEDVLAEEVVHLADVQVGRLDVALPVAVVQLELPAVEELAGDSAGVAEGGGGSAWREGGSGEERMKERGKGGERERGRWESG